MQFTVVTSVLNAVKNAEKTAQSIRSQKKRPQWIIVDGGSDDNIAEFVDANADIVTDFVPGPDKGIYDAWNKALSRVEGDWVVFLGAGDTFSSGDTLYNAHALLSAVGDEYEIAYGNTVIRSEKTNEIILRDIKPWEIIRGKRHFLLPILPSHAGVFHRRVLLERVGKFDDSYRIAADTKMQLEALLKGEFHYLGIDVANVVAGGVSYKAENHLRILREHRRIARELGITISLFDLARSYANAYAKRIFFDVLGSKMSYKLFDFFRKIKGLDEKWN